MLVEWVCEAFPGRGFVDDGTPCSLSKRCWRLEAIQLDRRPGRGVYPGAMLIGDVFGEGCAAGAGGFVGRLSVRFWFVARGCRGG